jgi:putative RNA 2'-phosphotransferase
MLKRRMLLSVLTKHKAFSNQIEILQKKHFSIYFSTAIYYHLFIMKTDKNYKSLSKLISLVLRHKPEVIGLTLDENGWADCEELVSKLNSHNKHLLFSMEDLVYIVDSDNKSRYKISEGKIRANQGHSINVDVELAQRVPPDILYHGTALRNVPSLMEFGILKQSRLYVHLSDKHTTASIVGERHGAPFVFKIDAKKMYTDGHLFYLSENNVWLTKHVPPEYLISS